MTLATDIKFVLKAKDDALELAKYTTKAIWDLHMQVRDYIKDKENLKGAQSSDAFSADARYIFNDFDIIHNYHLAIVELDKIAQKEARDKDKLNPPQPIPNE